MQNEVYQVAFEKERKGMNSFIFPAPVKTQGHRISWNIIFKWGSTIILKRLGHKTQSTWVMLNQNLDWSVFYNDLGLNFLSGTFNDLDHHQVAALASCFIPVDKSSEQIHLRSELAKPLQQLQESARKIAEVCSICLISCSYYA